MVLKETKPRQTHRAETLERIQSFAALSEFEMRRAVLCEHLEELSPEQSVWLLEWILRRTLHKHEDARSVYEVMLDPDPIRVRLSEGFFEARKETARLEKCIAALQWLLSVELPGGTADRPEQYVHHDLRELELGSRRALARRADRLMLDRLMVDPDPYVIENLLNHPQVTEQIVLGICTRRPTLSTPLETVMHSRRWMRNYRVKLALAQNPHLAPKLAVNLLAFLRQKDLRLISRDGTLSQILRAAAERLLAIAAEEEPS